MNSVPLSVNLPLWWRLLLSFSSSNVQRPAYSTFQGAYPVLRNQNCRNARSHKAATPEIRLHTLGCHSLATVRSRSANVTVPCRFPLPDRTDNRLQHTIQASAVASHETHANTGLPTSNPKTAGVHYTTIQMVHPNTPMQRHNNLTHYTELALI